MPYLRRIVTFDPKGRKLVTFRSMGDDQSGVNCEDEATWRADPTCQELHPGLYPTAPTAGASNAAATAPTAPTAQATPSTWGDFWNKLVGAFGGGGGATIPAATTGGGLSSAGAAAAAAGQPVPGSDAMIFGLSIPVVAVGGIAAYYLFFKKKRRK